MLGAIIVGSIETRTSETHDCTGSQDSQFSTVEDPLRSSVVVKVLRQGIRWSNVAATRQDRLGIRCFVKKMIKANQL